MTLAQQAQNQNQVQGQKEKWSLFMKEYKQL